MAGLFLPLAMLGSCEKLKNLGELARKMKTKTSSEGGGQGAVSNPSVENYPEFIRQSGKVVVVDFNATWCGPCKLVGPMLDRIAEEKKEVLVLGKVDVDQFADLAKREKVSSIPDIRVFMNGREVDRMIGAPPESELRARIQKHLANLAASGASSGTAASPEGKAPAIAPAPKDWMPKGMKKR